MITELEKQYNHTTQGLSIKNLTDECYAIPEAPKGASIGLALRSLPTGWTDEELEALRGPEEPQRPQEPTDKPRLVTRGPLPQIKFPPTPHKNSHTKLDTLSFTAKEPYWLMQDLVTLACPGSTFLKLKTGKNGYHSGFSVLKDKQEIAQLFYGSKSNERQNQKPQLMVGGNGKTDFFNWRTFHHYAGMMERPTITRADVANDCFDGSLTIEQVIEAHLGGYFKTTNAPRNPRITPYGQIQPDGTNPGRTIYIGSLSSAKSVRFYEKGYEHFKNLLNSEESQDNLKKLVIEETIRQGTPTIIAGYNDDKPFDLSKWLRAEVQFRNTNCDIPLDILLNHDEYFAGAYPFLKEVIGMAEGKVNPRFKTADEVELGVRILNMKAIAGSLIDDLQVLGWSNDEIIAVLRGGKGASQKLIKSGAFREG